MRGITASAHRSGRCVDVEKKDIRMDLKLEVIVLPVSDVDRASSFYEAAGFRMDADHATNDDGNGWVLQEVRKRAPGR